MADGITCTNNELSFEQLIVAVLNQVTATGCGGIRIEKVTGDNCSVIACRAHDSFFELLKRATSATNGYLTIRVAETEYQSGTGLEHLKECGVGADMDSLLRYIFVEDASGNVAIQLFVIT